VLLPLLLVWSVGLAVLAMAASSDDSSSLFLDPAYANGGSWNVGFVSQLGVLAWTTAAVSAGWAAWIARAAGRAGAVTFLARGALVSIVLLVDDLFGVHSLLPEMTGSPKIAGYLIPAIALGSWLLAHTRDILRTRYQLLTAALAGIAVSLLVDLRFGSSSTNLATLVEDSPKFLGILAWAAYFVCTTIDIGRSAMRQIQVPSGRWDQTSAQANPEQPTVAATSTS
jgi:hypothetical protein